MCLKVNRNFFKNIIFIFGNVKFAVMTEINIRKKYSKQKTFIFIKVRLKRQLHVIKKSMKNCKLGCTEETLHKTNTMQCNYNALLLMQHCKVKKNKTKTTIQQQKKNTNSPKPVHFVVYNYCTLNCHPINDWPNCTIAK